MELVKFLLAVVLTAMGLYLWLFIVPVFILVWSGF